MRESIAVDVTIDESGLELGQAKGQFQIVQNVIASDVTGDHSRILLATRPELANEPLQVMLTRDAR